MAELNGQGADAPGAALGGRTALETLLPLLFAILLLEVTGAAIISGLAAWAKEQAEMNEWPAWLLDGGPYSERESVAEDTVALALTSVLRLAQAALALFWVRRRGLQDVAGLRFGWSLRSLIVAGAAGALIALGGTLLSVIFWWLMDVDFVQETLLGGGPDARLQVTALYLAMLFAQGFAGPFAEEVVCRGLLYVPLRRTRGIVVSAAISATVFALLHRPGDLPSFAIVFVGGVLFAIACEFGRGLAAPLLVHMGYNAVLVVMRKSGG